jgi:S-adenosylmethionine-dependent methyltransferase
MADVWDALGAKFVDDHYASLRGRVRTGVIAQHLREHLEPPPLRVIDVGGGAGNQSIPLARSGYHVTIVDPSAAMLERAMAAIHTESAEVARRIALVEVSGEEAVGEVGEARFDVVLCHGVLMYLDDPTAVTEALCALAAPGGLVSIVAKNVDVMAMRPALAGEWEAALESFDATQQVNGLGVMTRGDRIDRLSSMLKTMEVDPIRWYGVRLFTDAWTSDRQAVESEELVLAVEIEASRRDPYRQLSRLFHLVGRKRRKAPTNRCLPVSPATGDNYGSDARA